MNLRNTILLEHSKKQTSIIIKWVGDNQQRFNELFELFISDDYRVVQRAAWPLSYVVIAHPFLIKPHYGRLLKNLNKEGITDAVKRNTLRLLQHIDIPQKHHGIIMDTCFSFISSPIEKPAIKAFSLTILDNLSEVYPEIRPELILIIEDRWQYETAAFHSRAKRILRKG